MNKRTLIRRWTATALAAAAGVVLVVSLLTGSRRASSILDNTSSIC